MRLSDREVRIRQAAFKDASDLIQAQHTASQAKRITVTDFDRGADAAFNMALYVLGVAAAKAGEKP